MGRDGEGGRGEMGEEAGLKGITRIQAFHHTQVT